METGKKRPRQEEITAGRSAKTTLANVWDRHKNPLTAIPCSLPGPSWLEKDVMTRGDNVGGGC